MNSQKEKKLAYRFYFDNLFTSFNLLHYFRDLGYGGTGTIRENRIPKDCILSEKRTLGKGYARGHHESVISRDDGILVAKWVDNGVVAIASNCHGTEPVRCVKRWSHKDRKTVLVPRPALVAEYNQFMGVTDRMDEIVSMQRIGISNKKCYWSILTCLIDFSIHNAWYLRNKSGNKQTQLEIRRGLVCTYLSNFGVPGRGPGRPISKKTISIGEQSDRRPSI